MGARRTDPVQFVAGTARRRDRWISITVAAVPAATRAADGPCVREATSVQDGPARLALTGLLERREGLREQSRRGFEVAGAQQLQAPEHPAVARELGLAAQAGLDVALHRQLDGGTVVDRLGEDRARPRHTARSCLLGSACSS